MDWQVTLDAAVTKEVTPDLLGDLAEELSLFDAAVAGSDSRASVVMKVTTESDGTPAVALEHAAQLFTQALETVGATVTAWHVGEVVSTEEADARHDRPTIPPLLGAGEAAILLKVSRQRVHQLLTARRHGFPAPVARPGAQPLWLESTIRAFADTWDRRVGRPPAKATTREVTVTKPGKAVVTGKTTTRKAATSRKTAVIGKTAAKAAARKSSR